MLPCKTNGSSLSLGQLSTGGGSTHQTVSLAFNVPTTDSGMFFDLLSVLVIEGHGIYYLSKS